jgi:hypothetical protein
MGSDIDVFKSSVSHFVLNIGVFGLVNVVEVEVFAEEFIAAVGRGVIDDDYKVVGVILQEDRVQIILKSEFCIIVVAGHDHAHGNFLSDRIQHMNWTNSIVLLLINTLFFFSVAVVVFQVVFNQS